MKPPRVRLSIGQLKVNGLAPRDVERFRRELTRALEGGTDAAKPGDVAGRMARDAAAKIRSKLPPAQGGAKP